MVPAHHALERLRDGNRRFVSDVRSDGTFTGEPRRLELTAGQQPFAVILGCSDSRVPVEIVFGQGLGDLFVIRVAGNIVAPSWRPSTNSGGRRKASRATFARSSTACGRPWKGCSSWVPSILSRAASLISSTVRPPGGEAADSAAQYFRFNCRIRSNLAKR